MKEYEVNIPRVMTRSRSGVQIKKVASPITAAKARVRSSSAKKAAPVPVTLINSSPVKPSKAPIPILNTDGQEILFSPQKSKNSPFRVSILETKDRGEFVRKKLKFSGGSFVQISMESFHYPQTSPHPHIPEMKPKDYLLTPLEATRRLEQYNKKNQIEGTKKKRKKKAYADYSSILIPGETENQAHFLTYYRQYDIGDPLQKSIFHSTKRKTASNGEISEAAIGAGTYGIVRIVELRNVVKENGNWVFTSDQPAWGVIKVFKARGLAVYEKAKKETELTALLGDYSNLPVKPRCWYDPSTGKTFMLDSYIPGRDLAEHIKNKTKFSTKAKYQIAEQLCLQGKYIWDRNHLHRDIKPANILVDVDAEGNAHLKYRDYGLAISQTMAALSISLGTPTFMPNVLNFEGSRQNIAADLYGIGATIKCLEGWQGQTYHMYTPFFKTSYPKYTYPAEFPEGGDRSLLPLFYFSNWLMQFKAHSAKLEQEGGKEQLFTDLQAYIEILRVAEQRPFPADFLADLEELSFIEPNETPGMPTRNVPAPALKIDTPSVPTENDEELGEVFELEKEKKADSNVNKENILREKALDLTRSYSSQGKRNAEVETPNSPAPKKHAGLRAMN